MERNRRPSQRRRRKRKRESEQTEASGEAGPPSKKSAPPPAPLEVLKCVANNYSDTHACIGRPKESFPISGKAKRAPTEAIKRSRAKGRLTRLESIKKMCI